MFRNTALLLRFAPKVIETREENRVAIQALDELLEIEKRTPEVSAMLDLLGTLIDLFERKEFPTPHFAPRELLAWLLEENDMKPADLANVMGGRSRVSEMPSARREVSKEQANRLGERIRMSAKPFRRVD